MHTLLLHILANIIYHAGIMQDSHKHFRLEHVRIAQNKINRDVEIRVPKLSVLSGF